MRGPEVEYVGLVNRAGSASRTASRSTISATAPQRRARPTAATIINRDVDSRSGRRDRGLRVLDARRRRRRRLAAGVDRAGAGGRAPPRRPDRPGALVRRRTASPTSRSSSSPPPTRRRSGDERVRARERRVRRAPRARRRWTCRSPTRAAPPTCWRSRCARRSQAWAEAVDGEDDALLAIATPAGGAGAAVPAAARTARRASSCAGRRLAAPRDHRAAHRPRRAADGGRAARCAAARYVEDRDTVAVIGGDKDREREFTEQWTFALDGLGRRAVAARRRHAELGLGTPGEPMPELPEAERARVTLESVLGRRIAAVDDSDTYVCRPHPPGEIASALVGHTFVSAHRRGKFLWLDTEDGPTLGLHLGMAGHIALEPPTDKPIWDRFTVQFEDGGRFALRDRRRLGRAVLNPDFGHVGPDAADRRPRRVPAADRRRAAPRSRRACSTRARSPASATCSPTRRCGRRGSRRGARRRSCRRTTSIACAGRCARRCARRSARAACTPAASSPPASARAPARAAATARTGDVGGRTTYWCPVCQE